MDTDSGPQLPNEMIANVLSHLSKSDLLNYRLVSSSWNELSLKCLKKSNWTQHLDLQNINAYVKFARETTAQTILPFQVRITQILPSAPLDPYSDVFALLDLAGQETVAGLEIRTQPADAHNFVVLLKRVSLGLRSLELCRLSTTFLTKINECIRKQPNLNFPKLKKLRSTGYSKYSDMYSYCSGEIELLSFFIENSGGITDFGFHGKLKIDCELKIPFQTLRTLSATHFVDARILWNLVRDSQWTPKLETFVSDYSPIFSINPDPVEWRIAMAAVLERFSPTLKNLHLYQKLESNQRGIDTQVPLSLFPVLEHLQITSSFHTFNLVHPIYLSATNMKFTPDNFPSLKSVDIPVGVIWSTENSEDLVFPTVKRIGLNMITTESVYRPAQSNINESIRTFQNFVDNIIPMFPLAVKLTLNTNLRQAGDYVVEQLIRALLLTKHVPGKNATGIQDLEIQNYEDGYLGSALQKLDTINLGLGYLPNVKTIALMYSYPKEGAFTWRLDRNFLDLKSICERFPNLRILAISSKILATDSRSEIKNKFSHLTLISI